MSERQRLEENGLYLSNPKHWELLEDITIYVRPTFHGISIPIDIVRHLGLKHKDKITIAILHRKEG